MSPWNLHKIYDGQTQLQAAYKCHQSTGYHMEKEFHPTVHLDRHKALQLANVPLLSSSSELIYELQHTISSR